MKDLTAAGIRPQESTGAQARSWS